MRQSSIVIRISVALACIVVLSAATMLTSYWISDKGDNDAFAINIAGSLRMQSYKVIMLANQPQVARQDVEAAVQRLEETWQHPLFDVLRYDNPQLAETYDLAYRNWQQVREELLGSDDTAEQRMLLARQVELINGLVQSIQQHAEANASRLRLVQVSSLFLILLLSAFVIYWLRTKVEQPLAELTRVAKRVTQGDFSYRVEVRELDELGMLAGALNRMSDAVAQSHDQMERQIHEQTRALQRGNTTLQFLYDTAKSIIEHDASGIDYDRIVSRLATLVEVEDVELCLMTEGGSKPYLQIQPEQSDKDPCAAKNCGDCLSTARGADCGKVLEFQAQRARYTFPMLRDQRHYGVLVCRMGEGQELDPWKQQLIQSVADQLAVAMSLQVQEDNARRLSLVHERTVIARELHDSLAQALSYLKIQVTRLNRAISKEDTAMMEDVSRELQEGLNSAYRQLRELLTTFRLKVEGPGLHHALQTSVVQLGEQTDMNIALDYTLSNVPLTPNEEIHMLQIVREATQNAIHHSRGTELKIRVEQDEQKKVHLSIEDNGIGIPDTPEKLNHYGLAIMLERGKNLGGDLDIRRRKEGGTGVYFRFTPDYLQRRSLAPVQSLHS